MLKPNNRNRVHGGVLITALIFALVVSLFATGVGIVASSHLSRSSVESDYATAIQLADAGVNFELRWLAEDISTAGARAHQASPSNGLPGAHTQQVANIPGGGSFTVSVLNVNGSSPWAPPNPVLIRSTGTVNGVSRTIEITGQKRGLFGEYAIYSIDEAKLGGSKAFVVGNMGTNGPVTFSGGNPAINIMGELTSNGYPSSPPLPSEMRAANVWWNPDPVAWPTVSEIANSLFPGGLSYLRTNNDNHKAMSFDPSDPNSLVSNATVVGVGTDILDRRKFNAFSASQNLQDRPGGARYANAYEGLHGNNVIIFPPGDYYFNGIKTSNNNGTAILIDNASGMVRIWVDGGNANDSLDLPVQFTSTDKNKFRLYYNNCNELSIGGNSVFNGSLYSHADGCQSAIKLHGNTRVFGSVIFENIWLTGNSDIIFPNNGGGEADSDYALWYGFMNTWREINPTGGAIFPDGTSR